MRVSFARVVAVAVLTLGAAGVSVSARAESAMAACGAHWKQAKAAGTMGAQTWPEFLKQCGTQTAAAPATPAAAPASSGSLFPWANPEPAPTAAASNQSVMAACGEQWKKSKAAGTTGGATWPQFLKQCRARTASASPSPAPKAAPAPAPTPAPAPAPASQSGGSLFPWMNPSSDKTAATPAALGAGQFSTDAEARYRCPTDKVVWVNNESRIYHYQGGHYYGHTKKGGFMCETDAKASGARVSKSHMSQHEPM